MVRMVGGHRLGLGGPSQIALVSTSLAFGQMGGLRGSMRVLSIFQMQGKGNGKGGRGGLASGPRGYIWRERRGNRTIVVAADLQADELQKIARGLQ